MNKKRICLGVVSLVIAAVLFAADQYFKHLVTTSLKPLGVYPLINNLLELSYLENQGAAFGMFKEQIWIVIVITVAAFIFIGVLIFRYKSHTFFSYAASTLLIAGGMGNLVDRLMHGYVVDYIHVMFFGYVFNFADCCVTVGCVLYIIHVIIVSYREKKKEDELASKKDEAFDIDDTIMEEESTDE